MNYNRMRNELRKEKDELRVCNECYGGSKKNDLANGKVGI